MRVTVTNRIFSRPFSAPAKGRSKDWRPGNKAFANVEKLEGFGGGRDQRGGDRRPAAVMDEINRADVKVQIKQHQQQRRDQQGARGDRKKSKSKPLLSRWSGPLPHRPEAGAADRLSVLREWQRTQGDERHVRVNACGAFFSEAWAGRQVASLPAPWSGGGA